MHAMSRNLSYGASSQKLHADAANNVRHDGIMNSRRSVTSYSSKMSSSSRPRGILRRVRHQQPKRPSKFMDLNIISLPSSAVYESRQQNGSQVKQSRKLGNRHETTSWSRSIGCRRRRNYNNDEDDSDNLGLLSEKRTNTPKKIGPRLNSNDSSSSSVSLLVPSVSAGPLLLRNSSLETRQQNLVDESGSSQQGTSSSVVDSRRTWWDTEHESNTNKNKNRKEYNRYRDSSSGSTEEE
ncbi:unnamed protein product [Thelazia callipaeda]|uniref:Uncharacterized protein n=1 Tax=Thelazia callipaeda TaxID=103827 RepID=A0A0N5CT68_THECL|nr:unnamed protein product [Thelazia callipaeda]